MKRKSMLLSLFCVVATLVYAQNTIPNPSFENWKTSRYLIYSWEEPVDWGTINMFGASVIQTTDAKVGTYAAKLVSREYDMSDFGMGRINTAQMATADYLAAIQTGEPRFGFSFTDRPQALRLWYKYIPAGIDTAQVYVSLQKWDGSKSERQEIAKKIYQLTETVSEWTQLTLILDYENADIPDTCIIDITSSVSPLSRGGHEWNISGKIGSTLYVDGLEFLSTVDTKTVLADKCTVYLSKDNYLNVTMPEWNGCADIRIYSVIGNLVKQTRVSQNTQIDVADLNTGIYMVQLTQNGKSFTQKISK